MFKLGKKSSYRPVNRVVGLHDTVSSLFVLRVQSNTALFELFIYRVTGHFLIGGCLEHRRRELKSVEIGEG